MQTSQYHFNSETTFGFLPITPTHHNKTIPLLLTVEKSTTLKPSISTPSLFGLDTSKGALFPLLVPLIRPNGRTHLQSLEPEGLAIRLIPSLLKTNKPLVVPVPAVIGLVLGGEAGIAGGGAGGLDFVEEFLLLGREVTGGLGEDFVEFVGVNVGSSHGCKL